MIFDRLSDPALPALATLDAADLGRITGWPDVRVLRMRYLPGARAVLHVASGPDAPSGADLPPQEGAIWFFAGKKARKLAQSARAARLDEPTQALFQAFPYDYHVPALADFAERSAQLAPVLIGGPAVSTPVLLRYRPGLSATFRWIRDDGRMFYVKLAPGEDVRAKAQAAALLAAGLEGSGVLVPRVAGVLPDLVAIAYQAAEGRPLDLVLFEDGPVAVRAAFGQAVAALRALWSLNHVPVRMMDRSAHLDRARRAQRAVALVDPVSGALAEDLCQRMEQHKVPVRLRPIHSDMKLEHVFLAGPATTLIDTESLSLGDPDQDLAQLESRVAMARLAGRMTAAQAECAIAELRRHAGVHYDWFLCSARLHCAKFHAQRPDRDAWRLMPTVLAGGPAASGRDSGPSRDVGRHAAQFR